jgi:RNA polymerase sigma factor (TIGR02999 family)
MSLPDPDDLPALLAAIHAGDAAARDRLFQVVYADLRRMAGRLMRAERPDHTLQPTAVVHEAFVRLCQGRTVGAVPNRRYFFGAAARAMRQVLVDHAAARAAAKRGGGRRRVPLDDLLDHLEARRIAAADLRDALERLETLNERQSQVVALKALYGYTNRETAERLEVSEATVEGDWRLARSWLFGQLKGGL